MADKRISQLIERTDIANNDVLPIVASGATTTNKVTISTIQDWMQDNLDVGVTSVGITLGTTGTDVNVSGSPITTSGNITINIPDASTSARGVVTTGSQNFAGNKSFQNTIFVNAGLRLDQNGTALPTFVQNISGTGLISSGSNGLGFNSANNLYFSGSEKGGAVLAVNNSAVRTYTLQDANGTLAFTSDLTGYVTLDTAQTITAQKTFSTSGSSDTMIISHGSGSGFALDVIKAGNGEAIRVTKTSGTGNAMTISGGLLSAEGITSTAPSTAIGLLLNGRSADNVSIIRFGANTGGGQYNTIQSTPNSLDIGSFGNTPITFGTNLSGGGGTRMTISGAGVVTLTGALNGTSLNFSGDIQTATRLISATGGQQILINANNGGSTNRIETTGTLPLALVSAAAITMAAGGTTPQITLATTGAVTLTGALNGTSASLSGNVTAAQVSINSTSTAFTKLFLNAEGNYSSSGNMTNGFAVSNGTTGRALNMGVFESGAYAWIQAAYINNADTTFPLLLQPRGGNVGIGTTSPSALLHLRNGNTEDVSGSIIRMDLSGINPYWEIQARNGSNGANRKLGFFTSASSGDVMTLTQAGNVGIGTASPAEKLTINSGAANSSTNYDKKNIILTGGFTTGYTGTAIQSLVAGYDGASIYGTDLGYGYDGTGYALMLSTNNDTSGNPIERMRITSGGNVLINRTSASSSNAMLEVYSTSAVITCTETNNNSSFSHHDFRNGNGVVGSITTSGSSTSFNTSSDYRLKENVKPVVNALSKLNELKPCIFNFIADADEEVMGFIAHEVQEVIPQAVTGEKDGFRIEEVEVSPAELDEEGNVITEAIVEEKEIPVYQGIDHSKLVPLLVAAIQELKTEIDSLKNQIK
jgi:hypothetical protein